MRCNQEKRVAHALSVRAVDHYLPCYTEMRQRTDRRVTLQMPLFPGYVFVRLPLLERMKALTVPNVVSLVGSGGKPSEISEEEVLWIRRGLEQGTARPHPYLQEGARILITSGIMSGMEGILLRRCHGARIVISIDSVFRSFVVELDEDCVRPLAAGSTGLRHERSDSFHAATA